MLLSKELDLIYRTAFRRLRKELPARDAGGSKNLF